jgi:hypothetical protein
LVLSGAIEIKLSIMNKTVATHSLVLVNETEGYTVVARCPQPSLRAPRGNEIVKAPSFAQLGYYETSTVTGGTRMRL